MTNDIKCQKSSDETLQEYLRGWNWGAFFFTWIWGLGNNVSIALLALIPIVNLVMSFALGANGNKWAWEKGNWRDLEHFRRIQRQWACAVLAYFLIVFLMALIIIILTIV